MKKNSKKNPDNIVDKYSEKFSEMKPKKTNSGEFFTIVLPSGKLTTVFIPVK